MLHLISFSILSIEQLITAKACQYLYLLKMLEVWPNMWYLFIVLLIITMILQASYWIYKISFLCLIADQFSTCHKIYCWYFNIIIRYIWLEWEGITLLFEVTEYTCILCHFTQKFMHFAYIWIFKVYLTRPIILSATDIVAL